jgi:hypothetical protein
MLFINKISVLVFFEEINLERIILFLIFLFSILFFCFAKKGKIMNKNVHVIMMMMKIHACRCVCVYDLASIIIN